MKTQNHNFQHFTGKKGSKSKRKSKVKVKQNHISKYPNSRHKGVDIDKMPIGDKVPNSESLINALEQMREGKKTIVIKIGEENGNS